MSSSSASSASSSSINNTATLVITSHGVWRDSENSFKLPIGINMIKATQIGVANILDQKIPNSMPKLVEDANKLQNTVDKVAHYQRELNSLDNNNCRYSLSCKTRLKRTPTAIRCANEYENEGDKDGTHYLDQVITYDNIVKTKGRMMPNKSFEIIKKDFRGKGKHNEYDDRMVLYLPDGRKVDILNNWMSTYNTQNIAESVIRKHRNLIETTLKDILKKIKQEYGLKNIIIIDLSCNLVDIKEDIEEESEEQSEEEPEEETEEDKQKRQGIDRARRNFIRTINTRLNSGFGVKTEKRNRKKKGQKTQKLKN